ncbi:octopamine receptor 1-like isoform X2 [Lineus longissimus]|uniref:octopamine receptor 1-like isoform X2 n=1 Tax=Lineus longissimus TaxID=88925 RepID=UPI00315D16FD
MMGSDSTTPISLTANTTTGDLVAGIGWFWSISAPGTISAIVLITIQTILTLCVLFGNGLVVVAFWRFKRLRISKTNYFLSSLAACDLLYGLSVSFGLAVVYLDVLSRNKYVCLVHSTATSIWIAMSVFSLFCIAVDRLIAVAWPFRYPNIVTRKSVIITKGVFFVLTLVVSSLPIFGVNEWHNIARCIPPRVLSPVYIITCSIFTCLLMFITLGIYFYIFRIAQSHFARIIDQEGTRDANGYHRPSLKDLKAAKMLLLVVIIFIVCWGTSFCLMAVIISNHGYSLSIFIMEHFGYCSILLSSALNPLVYDFRSDEFRWAFGKLLRRHSVAVDAPERCAAFPSRCHTTGYT